MLFPNFCSEILRKALFLESHRNFLRVGEPAFTEGYFLDSYPESDYLSYVIVIWDARPCKLGLGTQCRVLSLGSSNADKHSRGCGRQRNEIFFLQCSLRSR